MQQEPMRRRRRAVGFAIALALLAGLLGLAPATSARAAALSAPSKLVVESRTTTTLTLRWRAVASAPAYRVSWGTTKKANQDTRNVAGTTTVVSGLKPGRLYYLKVRVIDSDGSALSSYSSRVTRTTARTGFDLAAPTALTATVAGSHSLYLSWSDAGPGLRYRVRYSTSPAMKNASTQAFSQAGGTLAGLKAGKAYHLQVRVLAPSGHELSDYSAPVDSPVTRSVPAALTVATYNVVCLTSCEHGRPLEKPWTQRRDAVAAAITTSKAQVVSLQEAVSAKVPGTGRSQLEDLLSQLGKGWKATVPQRYNCKNPDTTAHCKAKKWGASKGTRIIYDTSALVLKRKGSLRLATVVGGDEGSRYATWAVFRQKASGKRFFYLDAHLANGRDAEGSTLMYDQRVTQATQVVELIKANNTAGLPVVLTGDFNSHKGHLPGNGPYDVFTAAGYLDPLGNTDGSWDPDPSATAEHTVNSEYNSFNDFQSGPVRNRYANGYHVDYVLASASVRVALWQMWLKVDTDDQFVGTVPSDHNLVSATLHLP